MVRVKDIAKALKVKMPSVTSALQKLGEKGLIHYEKYGYVDLTDEGKTIAEKVYSRHACLGDFFHEVLHLDRQKADEEACRIEHHLSPASCRQFYKLVQYIKSEKTEDPWLTDFHAHMSEKPLTDFSEGEEARIVRIEAEGVLKKRLMELGFRRGEKIIVVRYAPLQDPLQVQIKGYSISLRVEEARQLIVRAALEKND